jgi:lysophospholipase L1-like esterase
VAERDKNRQPLMLIMTCCPVLVFFVLSLMTPAAAVEPQRGSAAPGQKWVTVWAASGHGPYPLGNASAQPDLSFALPSATTGFDDQTLRLIVKPDLWTSQIRLRFSNAFGQRPLELDGVRVGLQATAGTLVPGTNRPVTFGGQRTVTIAPGTTRWSDGVNLPFVAGARPSLAGRKLAVSMHARGPTGPMTWHAKALVTSYLSAPGAGDVGGNDDDTRLPYSTTSWFFLDAIDAMAPSDTAVIACFGDSITDGTASTLNGDDRWPDVLSSRLHAAYGAGVSVVNAGIGGNRVIGPADYDRQPIAGGPGALDRLDRDVLSLSGVTTVIWLEGINDFGGAAATVETVTSGFTEGVRRMRAKGIRVIGATITSALNATNGTHGAKAVDDKRREANAFIRRPGVFDAVADFDVATTNPQTGELRAEYQPNSTTGGAGDKLHPNRAGYAAMAAAIDLRLLVPKGR